MSALRFHWDFFGPDAQPTAEHFCKHLMEFCGSNHIADPHTFTTMVQGRCVASLEGDDKHRLRIRDRVRPKRAELLAK